MKPGECITLVFPRFFKYFLLVFYAYNRLSFNFVLPKLANCIRSPLILIQNWHFESVLLRIIILIYIKSVIIKPSMLLKINICPAHFCINFSK